MVLCSIECVQQVSQYLGVSPIELHLSKNNVVASTELVKNHTIEGFSTIIQALAQRSEIPGIVGNDPVTKALTRQWLEYAVLYVNYADVSTNTKRILKEINQALASNTYITGTNLTIADIVLYYTLHTIMSGLTYQEKALYVNVSRWFDNIQQDEKLRQTLDLINFNLLHLYI
ncbi:eukaryotic translation elongation factor 1 epsilon-1 [Chelonus insularis]|uniref:eukaryotic translation elongation factor 1 epsilon-1 n=1 Tax=Chelonus insularis TaxID=460826 RepID=UPI00158D2DAB|nr:eukaryotic translation elongation factor 1 epsilon-1 [Chelonus insularis]